jgi:hypothetical protein
MLSPRTARSGALLACLLASLGAPLPAADADPVASPTPLVKNDAALDALTEGETITADTYARPVPRSRPRLREGDVLSEQGRLRVHGGVSITVGGSSEGSFYGGSGWVSYYDPVTGLGLSVGFSRMSGSGLPIDYFDPYGSRYRSGSHPLYPVGTQPSTADANRTTQPLFMRGASKPRTENHRETFLVDGDGPR